jgi:DNA-binding NarL/FixJ family response regulator
MALRRARIVIADQQIIFRQGLAHQLAQHGHQVLCEVDDGDALDRGMIDHEPNIVIVDRYLPKLDVLGFTQMLRSLQPDVHLLILVAYEQEARTMQSSAFLAGAAGCLSKELAPQAYAAAIRRLMDGLLLFDPDVMRRAARMTSAGAAPSRLRELTPRELEILHLVSEGIKNHEIAERLDISYYTVMKHVSNVINKLKVSNRMEAGLIFLRDGGAGLLPQE